MDPTMLCMVCGKVLAPVHPSLPLQPDGGVIFTTTGNYGSTVYDPISSRSHLAIFLCDEDLRAQQARVVQVTPFRPSPTYTYQEWTPGEEGEPSEDPSEEASA